MFGVFGTSNGKKKIVLLLFAVRDTVGFQLTVLVCVVAGDLTTPTFSHTNTHACTPSVALPSVCLRLQLPPLKGVPLLCLLCYGNLGLSRSGHSVLKKER